MGQTINEVATAIVDANAYMTIVSADAAGRPWATPVWFAHDRYREFLWVSRPDAATPTTSPRAPRSASSSSTRPLRRERASGVRRRHRSGGRRLGPRSHDGHLLGALRGSWRGPVVNGRRDR